MPDVGLALDVNHISIEDLPVSPFPAAEQWELFRVHFSQKAHSEILRHSQEDLERELCGVLVGEVRKDGKGPFLVIEEIIRGEYAEHQAAQVTFTHETWGHIHRVMDDKFSEKRIVGWYHTHPHFGIFLSSMDQFIHRNFFNLPWQVAFVVDPCAKSEGCFCWKSDQTARMRHYWIGDEEKVFMEEAMAESGSLAKKINGIERQIESMGKSHLFILKRVRRLKFTLALTTILFAIFCLLLTPKFARHLPAFLQLEQMHSTKPLSTQLPSKSIEGARNPHDRSKDKD